ncbi:MAG: hypothetical protein Fur0041_10850 [Bacteroidia bacterium]
MTEKDCYKLLNISPDASDKEIRKKWRLLTKTVHPDVNREPDAAAKFLELTAAVQTLLDPAERIKHDVHFGYLNKKKNKDTHNKYSFSSEQTASAKETVGKWSTDYEKAMAMREAQRLKSLKKHKSRLTVIYILLGVFSLLLILFIVSRFLQ